MGPGQHARRWSAAIGSLLLVALALSTACSSSSSPTAAAGAGTGSNPAPTPQSATAAGTGLIKGPYPGEASSLNGAGASFPKDIYQSWFKQYRTLTNVSINYQSIGSSGGIKNISDRTVDFGASDAPMTDEQLKAAKGGNLFHIPTVLGGVVPIYNIPGGGAKTRLKFTADTLAGIYLGKITKWNDPKLTADNAGVTLPDQDIVVVHRSDGSGTTFTFTDFLSTANGEWKSGPGKGTTVNWPVGIGGAQNDGVAGEVKNNPGAIGYVELIYATSNNLGYGQVKNRAGQFLDATLDSVTAAATSFAKTLPADLRASIVWANGDNAWPISTMTYLLVYENMPDQAKAIALTRAIWWATHDGQAGAPSLGFAPLPNEVVLKVEEKIQAVKTNGQPAFPGK